MDVTLTFLHSILSFPHGEDRNVISGVPHLFHLAKALDTLAEHLYEGLYHALAGRAEQETSA